LERVLALRPRQLRDLLRRRRGEAAAAGDDVRDLAPVDRTGEALVEVGMPREDGVRPEACAPAGAVDVVREAARATALAVGRDRRVVAGDDDGALSVRPRVLQARELVRQELQLLVAD